MVLAHYTGLAGNFEQATMQMLLKFPRSTEPKSYLHGEYAFHYTVQDSADLWYVCLADKAMSRKTAFGFLKSLQEAFTQKYTAEQVEVAIAEGMQKEFREDLKQFMETYNSGRLDRVARAMEQVKDINESLVDSLQKVMERQERIDLLVNRSEALSGQSHTFRRQTQQLQRRIRWENWRRMIICGLVTLLFVIVILMMNCGISFQSCR